MAQRPRRRVLFAKWAEYRGAAASNAVARARADIATRGLVATVVQDYYGLVAAQRKADSAQQALLETQRFLDITRRLESGGEVAHSDVVKAQIQVAQRTRDAQDAELAALKSRLGLSVLVFPDFRARSPSSTICRRSRRCRRSPT